MFNNVALDVFIGLVFVFLLYSLLATIIQEFIATRFAFRSKVLEKGILRMLEDGKTTGKLPYGDRWRGMLHLFGLKNLLEGKKIAPWFYAHPLIKYLAEDNFYSKPAYLRADNFSKVMIDLLKGFGYPESQVVQSIHRSVMDGTIYKLPINLIEKNEDCNDSKPDHANPAIRILQEQNKNVIDNDLLPYEKVKINRSTALFLKSLWQDSGADVEVFKKKLENWFDDTMERATGWYKRYTRLMLFFIGLIVAVVFNVDTIAIHRILSKDKNAREQLVQMAIRSREQLAPEVERQRRGETVSDSVLKNTYDLVAKDAAEATGILGLGRVWSDTCKMCEDSAENDRGFEARLKSLSSDSVRIYDSINRLQILLDNIRYERDSTVLKSASDSNKPALLRLAFDKRIAQDSIQLRKYQQSPLLKEYERMKAFKVRCDFIKQSIGNKWFVYAPNQSGGWETLLGWLITALALVLGAPFWFDLLSKLIKVRGTGTKVDTITNGADQATGAPTPSGESKPVTVNVNPNAGEEAVG